MLRAGLQNPDELSRLVSRISGEYRPNRVQRIAGDLDTLRNGAEDIFDVILAISVLEYIADVPGVIHRFVELLRPGGNVILQVPNPGSPWRYTEAAVSRAGQIPIARHMVRRQLHDSYLTIRPHGDRVSWRAALVAGGMEIVSIERVACGPRPPLRWFHPNLLVVATKPKSTN
jgi:2-polyprenyl-3-methyl-5-hydroxy-6-metoxy-1,4-benzoquinol methylase